MALDRSRTLTEEGFEHIATRTVALPHFVWRVDLDVEEDRHLRLAEELVLGLIAQGLTGPDDLERALGLDPGVIVGASVVNLLRAGMLAHQGKLEVTEAGRRALVEELTREVVRKEDVKLRHDPYRDQLAWALEGGREWNARDVRVAGLPVLPHPSELSPSELEIRHDEVQSLLSRFGYPWEDGIQTSSVKNRRDGAQVQPPARDIVRLAARKMYVAYRTAELEVWHHTNDDEWQWRLLHDGGEDEPISQALKQLEADGETILPMESIDESPLSHDGAEVHHAVEEAQQFSAPLVLDTDDHRTALKEAIGEARSELIIISPWLRTAAVDDELLSWLDGALRRHRRLLIWIGYGIESDSGHGGDWHQRNQRDALRKLHRLGSRHGGRLHTVELGNTHEKIVIVDGQFAIVTSFNWLSFKPQAGKGIRRETGMRMEDRGPVIALRDRLARVLRIPEAL